MRVRMQGAQPLGCRQAVRHQTLTLAFAGSNPTIPASSTSESSLSVENHPAFEVSLDPLAQLAEQLPFKQWVWSSNLQRVTKKRHALWGMAFFAAGDSNNQIAMCRWHIAATSSKTGGYHNFRPFRGENANESPAGHSNPKVQFIAPKPSPRGSLGPATRRCRPEGRQVRFPPRASN